MESEIYCFITAFLMQDINIAEQMVNRGFAKWVEHTADPVQQISLHQSNVRSGENMHIQEY